MELLVKMQIQVITLLALKANQTFELFKIQNQFNCLDGQSATLSSPNTTVDFLIASNFGFSILPSDNHCCLLLFLLSNLLVKHRPYIAL
jgi:hypothetical protein